MARVLITTLGSSGDIHPFIAIGAELLSRGHSVEMLVNPYYRERIVAEGLGFRAMGTRDDLLRVLHHPDLVKEGRSPRLIIKEMISGSVEPTIRGVEDSIREFKPDCIVRHHISLGSRWVAERHGIPTAACTLAPLFWFNLTDPAINRSSQIENAPPWLIRFRLWLGKIILRQVFDAPLNKVRRKLGFAPERDIFRREVESCTRLLGLWSPTFRGPLDGDPAHARICGFCTFDRSHGQESNPREVSEFLDDCERAGQRPIVFTLGTSVVHHHNGFYELACRAVEGMKRRALLLVGDMQYAPRKLPSGVAAFAYAPYRTVFPHAAAIVHHGGVGTTGAALASGKPTVIVPFANDEFDNARRAKKLGTSVTLAVKRLNEQRMREALSVATSQGHAKAAAEVAERMRADHGARLAADEIEQICGAG
jgi:UDP:flavonoid glycosyltransferase YjiC (YdhE family)